MNQLTHEQMMELTKDMPMKTIVINGEDYLQRHFAHMLADGTQVWYHRFLRNDAERHLHKHPWTAESTILVGCYHEERNKDRKVFCYIAGTKNFINENTLHRIVKVEPNTWSMMMVRPGRLPTWSFIDDEGKETIMETSPFEWHKDFEPRKSDA